MRILMTLENTFPTKNGVAFLKQKNLGTGILSKGIFTWKSVSEKNIWNHVFKI